MMKSARNKNPKDGEHGLSFTYKGSLRVKPVISILFTIFASIVTYSIT